MSKDTGGPAFPVQDASKWQAHGMTLRDYFAAEAVAVLLETDDCEREYIAVAKKCYAMADAMLEARKC